MRSVWEDASKALYVTGPCEVSNTTTTTRTTIQLAGPTPEQETYIREISKPLTEADMQRTIPSKPTTASQHGPEIARLLSRLFDNPKRRLRHMHVSWGDKAHEMTVEERAAAINRMLDDHDESGRCVPIGDIDADGPPQVDVRDWLKERGL
jgi:hypothetical protein